MGGAAWRWKENVDVEGKRAGVRGGKTCTGTGSRKVRWRVLVGAGQDILSIFLSAGDAEQVVQGLRPNATRTSGPSETADIWPTSRCGHLARRDYGHLVDVLLRTSGPVTRARTSGQRLCAEPQRRSTGRAWFIGTGHSPRTETRNAGRTLNVRGTAQVAVLN
jgi:hypothetical protein